MIAVGSWQYSSDHGQICQVIEAQTIWSETTCRVWLAGSDSVVRMPAARLASLEDSGTGTAESIAYVTAAARVADALTQDMLLAPSRSAFVRETKRLVGHGGISLEEVVVPLVQIERGSA